MIRKILLLIALTGCFLRLSAQELLDLRDVEGYASELRLPPSYDRVPYWLVDWIDILEKIDRNADIKTILLPDTASLFHFVVTLDLQADMPASLLYGKREYYLKKFNNLLNIREQQCMARQIKLVARIQEKGYTHFLWDYYLHRFSKESEFQVCADSFIARAYRDSSVQDAVDYEAIIRAYWGYAAMSAGHPANAATQFRKCYDMRKKRGETLQYAVNRLCKAYIESHQIDSALVIYNEVLDKTRLEAPNISSFRYDDMWRAMQFLAEHQNAEKAIRFFEDVYAGLGYDMEEIWVKVNALPYYHAAKYAKTDELRLKYFQQWSAALEKYGNKEYISHAAYQFMLATKDYHTYSIDTMATAFFEKFFFFTEEQYRWYYYTEDEVEWSYWNQIVPYPRLLFYAKSLDDTSKIYQKWMQMAYTSNESRIVLNTISSISNKYYVAGYPNLAGSFFYSNIKEAMQEKQETDYYVNQYQFLQTLEENFSLRTAISLGKKGKNEIKKWIDIIRECIKNEIFADFLQYIAGRYYIQKEYRLAFEIYDQELAFLKSINNYQYEGALTHIMVASRNARLYPLCLKYTIDRYENKITDNNPFDGLSPLVYEAFNDSDISTSDKRTILKGLEDFYKKKQKQQHKNSELLKWLELNIKLLKEKWG